MKGREVAIFAAVFLVAIGTSLAAISFMVSDPNPASNTSASVTEQTQDVPADDSAATQLPEADSPPHKQFDKPQILTTTTRLKSGPPVGTQQFEAYHPLLCNGDYRG